MTWILCGSLDGADTSIASFSVVILESEWAETIIVRQSCFSG